MSRIQSRQIARGRLGCYTVTVSTDFRFTELPLKNGRLTPQERVFVGHMARTGDAVYSAAKAGYAQPENRGPEKARTLRNEVLQHFDDLIVTELVPLAFERLKHNLTDKAVPPGAANQAVKLVFDRAYRDDADMLDRDPSEMTLDEIVRKQQRLQAERESRAKDVTPDSGVFD
jgi:phage terminase small subunit